MCCVCYMHAQKYFASGIGQNGEETEGIQGFLIKHIQSEVVRSHRGKIPRCMICKKKGATVGCAVKSCSKVGHYPCVKKFGGFVFQYYDRFMAFCPLHCPQQRCLDLSSLPVHTDTQTCCICLSRIKCEPSLHELYCPTCLTFLHRDCLQVKMVIKQIYSETTLLDRLASSISFQGLCNFLSVN